MIAHHNNYFAESAEIEQVLDDINRQIHSVGLYFQYDKPDSIGHTSYKSDEVPEDCIIVMASFDFTYYHQVEFAFYNTAAHNLPDAYHWRDYWEKNQLVLLGTNERAAALNILKIHRPFDGFVFAFNCGSFGDEQYFIAASGFSYLFELVFYYDREANEALKPNERIAWWVGRSKK